jgi:hypothetical protein
MIPRTLLPIVACLFLVGCVSRIPFVDAERGKVYGLADFERALVDEKIHYLENELRNLRAPEPTDPNVVKLTPFTLRDFPTLAEWRKMKEKAKPGDIIVEYHHRLYLKYVDGAEEANRRGFALVRNNQIIDFVFVGVTFPSDY